MSFGKVNIRWLGHASFLIKSDIDDTTIYIDPFKTDSDTIADYIFITHTHYDHFSLEDINKVSNRDTKLFAPLDAQPKLQNYIGEIILVEPENKYQKDNILIETIPAYNEFKTFHPKTNNWVGYVIYFEGKRILHAGDTDAVDELKKLQNIDIAMLPIGGTYTMDAKEAAEVANIFKPKIVIPMHYGSIVGSEKDTQILKEKFNGETRVLKKL